MIQNDNYFRFDMYGDNWSELIAPSKYVFQNKDNKVGNFNSLPFYIKYIYSVCTNAKIFL